MSDGDMPGKVVCELLLSGTYSMEGRF